MDRETYRRTVRFAAEMVDGYEQLAKRLCVTKTEVKDWAAGSGAPGTMTFLLLLDLIAAETGKLSHEAMAMGLAEAVIAKAQSASRCSSR